MPSRVIAINATLKKSGGEKSSTDAMIDLVASFLKDHDADLVETIRLAAHDIHPGVTSDEGEGDAWPAIRARIRLRSSRA